ncbi:lysophospholipid acyltransferase family protein [Melaminivora alkalimesophila]|uniref:1-acyl-sn-glycerol-3-phosphate acyltransferase n=1 Tax=Melaminivora alkalimesophila TaxID=1165852 RepID=A0A317RCV4_9BURK|nr:lysophospholipid acyltransferase family protein [Melaminivora alkalimesophila]PWW43762.1 1-acyl-sn-glycerol-3-phosphate acyltransferase [Melaminivora alkalimesophila]
MSLIRSILHLLVLVVTVIPYTFGVLLVRALTRNPDAAYRVARAWLRIVVLASRWVLGIRPQIEGLQNLPLHDPAGAVLLAKHQSAYETFLLPAMLPRPIAYVFKKELLAVPFFGWSIGSLDMIHIDRDKPTRAFARVLQQGRRLLAKGTWVIMFPEGTRVPRGAQGEYKSGGTRLAIDAGVPVVPIAVASATVWPPKAFVKRPGVVRMSIGAPIASAGRKPDELMREVEAWIEAEMRRLDPEAYPADPAAAAPSGTPS